MSMAVHVPAPHAEGDVRARSDALRRCLLQVLQQTIDSTSILALEVSCPLLRGGPVVVERRSGSQQRPYPLGSVPSILVERLPVTQHVPQASLRVSVTSELARAEARVLPVLLSAVMDGELSRLAAEGTARGALEIANRDPATGLGNRRAWLHTLNVEASRAQRTRQPFTVLVLDIDGLKAVNDAHGHAAGDALIARAAAALTSTQRATDHVCRLGGDEFGIAAPDTDHDHAQLLAARVRHTLQDLGVPVSLGWAVSTGNTGLDDLWQQADTAMYQDKRSRRP